MGTGETGTMTLTNEETCERLSPSALSHAQRDAWWVLRQGEHWIGNSKLFFSYVKNES